MQQKPMTISVSEFNEKIKNNLRDYYIYQFKRFQKNDSSDYRKKGTDESKPASTFTEEKQRLLYMLESQSQICWTTEKGGICYCSADSRSLDKNPFWEPYRFCAAPPKYLGWFLSMVLLLHPQVQLRDPNGAPEPIVPRFLQNLRHDTAVGMKAMSQAQLQSWIDMQLANYISEAWGEFCLDRFLSVHRQRINGRKMVLEDDPNCFGASGELLQKYYSERGGHTDVKKDQLKNRLNETCSGILSSKRLSQRKEQWKLSDNTLLSLRDDPNLRFRFQQMVGYFSQTLPLGFVGERLQVRLGKYRNLIRYRHNYIIKALNDYNIVDLLHAISHGQWLRVEFRNGRKLRYQQMVCFPLQIRESVRDGRQYLMYYHPGYRSLGSLRLDFIDRIHYGAVEDRPYYAEDIARAQETLSCVWGVSVPGFFQGNMISQPPCAHIRLVLRRDTPALESRLLREKRHGSVTHIDEGGKRVTYEVLIADPREMIPWIRSYAKEILGIWVDGAQISFQAEDPAAALRRALDEWIKHQESAPERHAFQDDVSFRKSRHPGYPHEYLFNPLFSTAFDTIVQTVSDMMQQPDRYYLPRDLETRIARAWPEKLQLQEDVLEDIFEDITMLCSGSNRMGYRLDYIPTEEMRRHWDTLWDMIPLSDLETSYLKGILCHPKAELFLSQQEIRQLLEGLRGEPISFDMLYYHDQYNETSARYARTQVRENFAALLDAARCGGIHAVYTEQGRTTAQRLTVVRLEYSKLEDQFWVCCVDDDGRISFRELEMFDSISPVEGPRDPEQLQALADKLTSDNSRRLVLTFTDEKNRAERLATEFSPWKKTCVSRDTAGVQSYSMELFYDVREAVEIANRLLSYGEGIQITSDSGDVSRLVSGQRRSAAPVM